MRWRVILEQDADTADWAASVTELRGCASAGTSKEEALTGLREAIELYLRTE